jgi:hypothetical protein
MNLFKIKKTADGEAINMGRFRSVCLKRQIERELDEDMGFCVVGYRDPVKCLPTMIFFRKGGENIIRGIENLDTSKVVYVNVHFKKGRWIMKISNALKGGEK